MWLAAAANREAAQKHYLLDLGRLEEPGYARVLRRGGATACDFTFVQPFLAALALGDVECDARIGRYRDAVQARTAGMSAAGESGNAGVEEGFGF